MNDKQFEYFNNSGTYKYIDEDLKLKIIYNEESIIETYDEMLKYLKQSGYTCTEGVYYE